MKKAVLLVDDDAAHRFMTVRALRGALPEIDVIEAGNSEAAARLLADPARQIALAIVDYKLDHENGVDVVSAMRRSRRLEEVPAIMVSTSDLPRHMEASYAAGANCFVVKGVDPARYSADLLSAVRFLLRGASPPPG